MHKMKIKKYMQKLLVLHDSLFFFVCLFIISLLVVIVFSLLRSIFSSERPGAGGCALTQADCRQAEGAASFSPEGPQYLTLSLCSSAL